MLNRCSTFFKNKFMKVLIFIIRLWQYVTFFKHTGNIILVIVYLDNSYSWWKSYTLHVFIDADWLTKWCNLIHLSKLSLINFTSWWSLHFQLLENFPVYFYTRIERMTHPNHTISKISLFVVLFLFFIKIMRFLCYFF